eukprot:NODE_9361_length_1429_cov_5.788786.p1 GENE.NODE_9361_length_1429_cov_5.788786~~NODE_9361_length_1429_cov_5.788786.p1  ORF type:complete len:145 (+),score=12.00 NODE_9361_length_1429_cov_5.788786:117-551(+)
MHPSPATSAGTARSGPSRWEHNARTRARLWAGGTVEETISHTTQTEEVEVKLDSTENAHPFVEPYDDHGNLFTEEEEAGLAGRMITSVLDLTAARRNYVVEWLHYVGDPSHSVTEAVELRHENSGDYFPHFGLSGCWSAASLAR